MEDTHRRRIAIGGHRHDLPCPAAQLVLQVLSGLEVALDPLLDRAVRPVFAALVGVQVSADRLSDARSSITRFRFESQLHLVAPPAENQRVFAAIPLGVGDLQQSLEERLGGHILDFDEEGQTAKRRGRIELDPGLALDFFENFRNRASSCGEGDAVCGWSSHSHHRQREHVKKLACFHLA